MIKNRKNRKGFTLIELLVVIAIIAVLAVVVVLTLNPAELLRQARDSNRLSDFATLKSALALYSTDVVTSTPMYGTAFRIYLSDASATTPPSTTIATYNTAATWGFLGGETLPSITTSTSRAIDGSGWIPVAFSQISSGAPIGTLPVDPTNNGQQLYAYAASTTVFKLATKMESAKYTTGGPADVQTSDGGNSTGTYEQGSNLTAL
jgi:prepilin-type N-terminal cleavage/methylation domain-containing protein